MVDHMRAVTLGLLATLLVGSWSPHAAAEGDTTRAAARELATDGVKSFQAGEYESARDKLERAFQIVNAPSIGLWSARALSKLGKLVEASERYLEVTRLDATKGETAVQKQAQVDAAKEREELLKRIPEVSIDIQDGARDGLTLTVDGSAIPLALLGARQPMNPGHHVIEARRAAKRVRREVQLAEGGLTHVSLDLPADGAKAGDHLTGTAAPVADRDEPSATRTARPIPAGVWVGLAVAGAGTVVGVGSALLASHKKSSISADCPSNVCSPDKRSEANSYNQLLTVSTIGFVVTGVGLAAAGTFWLTAPSANPNARQLKPWIGIASVGVDGTF